MAKITIKENQISSSAGIIIPSDLSISGSLVVSDILVDAVTVGTNVLINEDLDVLNNINCLNISFSASNTECWTETVPATISEAINRIALFLKSTTSSSIP
jgi:hypothetical protein